jgi:hypothetical protein
VTIRQEFGISATESPAFPGAVRVTSDWFHVRDRGKPTGVYPAAASARRSRRRC